MQITYEAHTLQPVLEVAQFAVRKRSALPILNCALAIPNSYDGTLTLTVNSLEQAVTVTVPVLTDGNEPSVLPVLPVARLNSLLSGTVVMTAQQERIHVRCGQAEYEIATFGSADEYPPTKETPTVLTAVPTRLLLELFGQVSYAISKETLRPVLTGVRVVFENDMLAAAATDTHRLVYKRVQLPTPVAERYAMTVPAEAFALLQRVYALTDSGPCEVCIGEDCAAFRLQHGCVWTQLLVEPYPNWERVIPEGARLTVVAQRNTLLERLRRISIAAPETQKIYLDFKEDALTVHTRGDQFTKAEETMELITPPQEPIELAININYLTQAIKGFGGETITMEITEPLRPIKVYDNDPAMHAAVIMPMAP